MPKSGTPLSRERVLRAAVAVADEGGLGSLTIRSLARELGVKPMSVYHYVANKDEILDGVVDLIFGEMEVPSPGGDWRAEIHRRATSARRVLSSHPWAIGLLDSRTAPGPATLRHHDATIGVLRGAGFSVKLSAHAYALLDSYIYGFALQEAALPFRGPDTAAEVTETIMQGFSGDEYPNLVEMATEHILRPGYDFGDEFEFGLNVILDALAAWLRSPGPRGGEPEYRRPVDSRRQLSTVVDAGPMLGRTETPGGVVMRMVSIRNLRGEELKRCAHAGELVGVMKTRRLIGVMIPITPNWVAHVIENNWSRVLQSVTEGERALADDVPLRTLENALVDVPVPAGRELPDRALPMMLASTGLMESADGDLPPARSLRVGDLSAAAIERAGEAGEILAVTHAGEMLGVLVPVTQRLVGYLVNKNMSRVLYNIGYGEKEAGTGEPMRTLERALAEHSDVLRTGPASRRS
ncbi:TetR/AcrR family transcriptional regulator [Actinoplanes sp. NPDC051346]|uniref:TetR/AcrR family transcriptional regulator n=1 Tax=Actinoplanes sp. NPDC051346 TaxID=3155048 RepID=UPI00341392DE